MCPISFETVLWKPPKNSKQIFLFKIIAINCSILVDAIFQPMHCSRKISNRNSLQFRHYRCLNVTYGCISVPLQLHFQLQKCEIVEQTHIRRVRGWLSLLHEQCTVPIVLLSAHLVQILHTVFFFFFKSSDRMWWTKVFGIPVLSTIILLQGDQ